jgi:hypothetical protein
MGPAVAEQLKGPVCAHVQDDRMQDMMTELRGKFKTVCARLGLTDILQFTEQTEQQRATTTLQF